MRHRLLLLCLGLLTAFRVLAAPPVRSLTWNFPITRPHTGILLGNGTQGLMVWGKDRQLNITVGRAGFWDHRGGNEFSARTTFADVKRMLQAGDEAGIRQAFDVPKTGDQGFGHPQQLGGGRLEITLAESVSLDEAKLLPITGQILIYLKTNRGPQPSGKPFIQITQAHDQELAECTFPPNLVKSVRLVPAWEQIKTQLMQVNIPAPQAWQEQSVTGVTQPLPQDVPLSMAHRTIGNSVFLATALGADSKAATVRLLSELGTTDSSPALVALRKARNAYWAAYWDAVPRISVPDPALQEIIDYGLYKQACSTPPQGLACALQGPFMEDYQVVPWSNDYHFNINIQMIYWPALATNRLSHFGPLWTLIKSWMPQLQQNGEAFFGRKGALMLPHAVDDRCRVVGTFWTGTIDHACTAWMAQMAWQHYRYGLDQPDAPGILSEVAWPLLVGAFEGYYAMLEEVDNGQGGKRWSLPVSVSPEYRGSRFDAWGRDASFQLAALHRVCRILPQAARALGKPIDPRWADVDQRLPPYTTFQGLYIQEWTGSNERIALWEGMDLIESHRHHSHLGGIYPFATIDLQDSKQRQIVQNSLVTWRYRGAGGWSGWCVPWASILLARTGQTEAAVNWLHYWKDNYTNEGRGTLHNANNNGTTIMGAPDWNREKLNREIMQLDGGFGALNAALELLVQSREDGIYVLPNLSRTWRTVSFDNIRTEGAFQIGATVEEGKVREVRVKSLAGGSLRLVHGLGGPYQVNGQTDQSPVLERTLKKGETLVLRAL